MFTCLQYLNHVAFSELSDTFFGINHTHCEVDMVYSALYLMLKSSHLFDSKSHMEFWESASSTEHKLEIDKLGIIVSDFSLHA